jgi:hypothetical protein
MQLLHQLSNDFGVFEFKLGDRFSWSAKTRIITYTPLKNAQDTWSILHELGHATLGHTGYKFDIELLKLEVEAWDKAVKIGKSYDIVID